jgi:glycosyltransferase involved in cell wall biosynthesis
MIPVSLVTITRNRKEFIPLLVENYNRIKIPNLEWIILDDSPEQCKELYPEEATYIHLSKEEIHKYLDYSYEILEKTPELEFWYKYHKKIEHLPIGMKRNIANTHTNGEIIIHMDDDDYYCEKSLEIRLYALQKTRCIFCPMIVGYDLKNKLFFNIGSESTMFEGTLAYFKSEWEDNKFNNLAVVDEGVEFVSKIKNYKRIKSEDVIVALIHEENHKLFNTKDLIEDFKPPWDSINIELNSHTKSELWLYKDYFKFQKKLNYVVINPENNITSLLDENDWKGIYIGSDSSHINYKGKDARKIVDILKKNNFPKKINFLYLKKKDSILLDIFRKKYNIEVLISDFGENQNFKNRVRSVIKDKSMVIARKFEDQDWMIQL